MVMSSDEIVSAQVVLRSASGKKMDGNSVITGETLSEYLPSPEAVSSTMAYFTTQGFVAKAAVGISFSITASVATFVRQFEVSLRRSADGGIQSFADGEEGNYELPLDNLPENIRVITMAITFTSPPAFGPVGFG